MDYESMLPESEWARGLDLYYRKGSLKGRGLEAILL